MTAISFKSHSGDDYLEISENEPLDDFLLRIKESYGDEWNYLDLVLVKSTNFKVSEIERKLKKLDLGNEPED